MTFLEVILCRAVRDWGGGGAADIWRPCRQPSARLPGSAPQLPNPTSRAGLCMTGNLAPHPPPHSSTGSSAGPLPVPQQWHVPIACCSKPAEPSCSMWLCPGTLQCGPACTERVHSRSLNSLVGVESDQPWPVLLREPLLRVLTQMWCSNPSGDRGAPNCPGLTATSL